MSTLGPKFDAIVAELKAHFPNLSDSELSQKAIELYQLELQKTVNNFTQPPQPERKAMSVQEYQTKLREIESQIKNLELEKTRLGYLPSRTKNPNEIKRINSRLEELYKIKTDFVRHYAMNTYDDSSSDLNEMLFNDNYPYPRSPYL